MTGRIGALTVVLLLHACDRKDVVYPSEEDYSNNRSYFENVVSHVRGQTIPPGSSRTFRRTEFTDIRVTEPCSSCGETGHVTAHRTKSGEWVISISTLHLHHGGEFGYVFASDEKFSENEVGSIAFGGMPQVLRRFRSNWFTYRVD